MLISHTAKSHFIVFCIIAVLEFFPTILFSQTNKKADSGVAPQNSAASSHQAIRDAFGKIALRFELNIGQAPTHVKFLAHGRGYKFGLSSTGAILTLDEFTRKETSDEKWSHGKRFLHSNYNDWQMTLVNAKTTPYLLKKKDS